MQINDLLGANEVVRLKGKVEHCGKIKSITITNKNIYFYYENEGEWKIIKYNDIISLHIRYSSNKWGLILGNPHGSPDYIDCPNRELAEQVFLCIKQCWDEAKCVEGTLKGDTNYASSTSFRDESKKSEGTWSW